MIELLEGLLLHQGRCFRAEAGKSVPMIASISLNVIGIFWKPVTRKWFSKAWYFELDTSMPQEIVTNEYSIVLMRLLPCLPMCFSGRV